jgi:molybdopterin/thiamine biosynthesis adenylyltransferase
MDDRYSRQIRFESIGESGQTRLLEARVGIVGLGALGTVVADQLVRAGVGYVRLIDRDFVELSNLQRQTLYEESDALKSLPKAVASEEKLRRINSTVRLDAIVEDFNPSNAEDLIADLDLVMDGLDNFETRFVLNDACRQARTPWIYAAAVGSYGLVMPVLPDGPCLRCLMDTLPAAGSSPTCDTAGVIAPITGAIASIAVAHALRLLTGQPVSGDTRLVSIDIWSLKFQSLPLSKVLQEECPLCSGGQLDYLNSSAMRTISLCGRNAVQVIPGARAQLDLLAMGKNLELYGPVRSNDFLLKCENPPYELTLFRDGRAIIKGTEEASVARSVYSKMVGL